MSARRIVRILASVRIPSGHGPDLDYEIVHAMVASEGEGAAAHESVILRFAEGQEALNDVAPEILSSDLPALHAEWTRFVTDVLRRRAQAGDKDAQTAYEKMQRQTAPPSRAAAHGVVSEESPVVISASGGRFGVRTKMTETPKPETAAIVSMGPRRASARVVELSGSGAPPPPPPPEPPKPVIPSQVEIVDFGLSNPPTVEGLMRLLQAKPEHLIVVAPLAVAKRVEDFIRDTRSGAIKGRPTTFSPIVIHRGGKLSPAAQKKLQTEIAGGIPVLIGDMNSALWILPA